MYAYGNGSYGCLFDHVEGPFATARGAAEAAAELFELNTPDTNALAGDHILHQRDVTSSHPDDGWTRLELGADYIEIFEVDADWTGGAL